MKIENISKFLKYIVPLSLSTFFILFFMKKNNIDYVSVDMDIPGDLEIERINEKSSSIKKFQLRPFIPDDKYKRKSPLSALNNNPFEELGTVESSYNQLPNDLKFTGILKVGDKKGVFVSSTRGLDVLYSGQEVSKGYKIISIDSQKAEITISNGLNTKLVKLEQD
tara:strand:+ start:319 stop:816 length:498 start_codon:yes stop_codon:yes gene_type:complete